MNRLKNFLRDYLMKRIMNRPIIFSLFLILLFACPGWGATYYVKNGGNDSLDGLSDANAWATIAKVKAKVTSGDTVYFRSQDTWSGSPPVLTAAAGVTYNGSTYGIGTRAKIQASGAGDGLGVVGIYASNVTFSGFEVDGNSQNTYGVNVGTYATGNVSAITVSNCAVHHTTNGYGILIGARNSITTSNVTIVDTTVYNSSYSGIDVYPSWQASNNVVDTVLIRNCTVYNSNTGGIGIVNNADNVTVEFCHLYNNGVYGMIIRTSSAAEGEGKVLGGANNFIIRYNEIHNNNIYGIFINKILDYSISGDIYGNLIYSNGSNGGSAAYDICLDESSHDYTGSTVNLYNNTIYNTTNSCTTKQGVHVGAKGTPTINFKNNIMYTSDWMVLYDVWGVSTHSNNLVYRSSGASDTHVVVISTTYNRDRVKTWEATAQNTDPAFTGGTLPTGFTGTYGTNMVPNTNYFKITSGNALNNGATLGSPYDGCINGAGLATPITRPQGAAYDIGAYEYLESVRETIPPAAPKKLRINNQ